MVVLLLLSTRWVSFYEIRDEQQIVRMYTYICVYTLSLSLANFFLQLDNSYIILKTLLYCLLLFSITSIVIYQVLTTVAYLCNLVVVSSSEGTCKKLICV